MSTRTCLGNKGLYKGFDAGEIQGSPFKLGDNSAQTQGFVGGSLAGYPWISPGFLIGAATKYFLALTYRIVGFLNFDGWTI